MTDIVSDPIEANDDMSATFLKTWKTYSPAVTGDVPPIRWKGKTEKAPDPDGPWVRFQIDNVLTEQAALADANSKRRDESSGLVTIQLFVPLSSKDGWLVGNRLAIIARKAFLRRSLSGKIWFRRARIVPLDPDGEYHRLNVIAEYEYD